MCAWIKKMKQLREVNLSLKHCDFGLWHYCYNLRIGLSPNTDTTHHVVPPLNLMAWKEVESVQKHVDILTSLHYPGQKKKPSWIYIKSEPCDVEEFTVWFRRDAALREVTSRVRSVAVPPPNQTARFLNSTRIWFLMVLSFVQGSGTMVKCLGVCVPWQLQHGHLSARILQLSLSLFAILDDHSQRCFDQSPDKGKSLLFLLKLKCFQLTLTEIRQSCWFAENGSFYLESKHRDN